MSNDDASLAFGDDMIVDMTTGNSDQYGGWSMDIFEGERPVRSIAFQYPSQDRLRA